MTISTDTIEAILAGTQCEECGYKGCKPYAEALAHDEAEINLCRPGGERVIKNLAELLGKKIISPAKEKEQPLVAWIDPVRCIGCMLCIKACPTDAIIGRAKKMHSVWGQECTGCRLCIEPCPVDCIEMHDAADLFPHAGEDAWEEMRSKEVAAWVKAKKARRTASGVDLTEQATTRAPSLTLNADIQAKITAAREAARKKSATKGPPPKPKKQLR